MLGGRESIMRRTLVLCVYVNAVIAIALSLYLSIIPAGLLIWDLGDAGLHGAHDSRGRMVRPWRSDCSGFPAGGADSAVAMQNVC
jgi:hypothetical protein